jgi:hypothetical protein
LFFTRNGSKHRILQANIEVVKRNRVKIALFCGLRVRDD